MRNRDFEQTEIHFGTEAVSRCEHLTETRYAYWKGVLQNGSKAFASNLKTRPGIVQVGNRIWPLTVNDHRDANSYPCSLYTQYVTYPKAELSLIPDAFQRKAARVGFVGLDGLLGLAKSDRVVQWSSWLFSTNLHERDLASDIAQVTEIVASAFPDHAVLVKNIHGMEDAGLPQAFQNAGYELITSRQIYFFDGRKPDFLQKSTVKRDIKALGQLKGYSPVEHEQFENGDLPRITELYRLLYLDKHSWLNPQYTEEFVSRAWRERWLEFRGLRHESGRLDAVFGCFTVGTTTSTPFIGYDTRLSADIGFYRHLVSMLLARVAERRWLLNYSSGAGDFKRRRGGTPIIEYNAVYHQHLQPLRSGAFHGLAELANRWGKQFLEENEI